VRAIRDEMGRGGDGGEKTGKSRGKERKGNKSAGASSAVVLR
jgi:hypothetical protein